MTNEDKRNSDSDRRKIERRSGKDTRSETEKLTQGERRSGKDKREIEDRRE